MEACRNLGLSIPTDFAIGHLLVPSLLLYGRYQHSLLLGGCKYKWDLYLISQQMKSITSNISQLN